MYLNDVQVVRQLGRKEGRREGREVARERMTRGLVTRLACLPSHAAV